MPKQHGGYRAPPATPKKSGPGKYSQRTDGVPSLDNPDIQYGEVKQLMEARRQNPLPQRTPEQTFAPPGASQSASGQSGGGAGGPLPESIFSGPTNRPAESITTGLDRQIQPPDDTRALLLQKYARMGNVDAQNLLAEYMAPQPATPAAPMAPTPTAPPVEEEPLDPFAEFDESPEPEPPVETEMV